MSTKQNKLRITPLGGIGEIGRNVTMLELGEDMILIDCGSIFPSDDMLGIDLVIPDLSYVVKNRANLRGILFTHGHEDHIGAIPYALQQLGGVLPLYGTELTLAFVENKLKEHKLLPEAELNVVSPGDVVTLGGFEIEFIHVNHSMHGAVALAIKTSVGTVLHTGDFKIDYTPVDGSVTDLGRIAYYGRKGVLALMMESTNVEHPGYTMSERKVGETLHNTFTQAKGRIIISMFASNIHRIQMVVDAARAFGRKVCFNGRSMITNTTIASELGILHIPNGTLIDLDDIDDYPDDKILIFSTGSQGEPLSALSRMAFSEHRKVEIRPTDTVVISASSIPGNEVSISRVIDQLFRKGANVIYSALADVHVSGHAKQEELKLIHTLVRPKFFIPIHGEYRHLHTHRQLAITLGMDEEHALMPVEGQTLLFSKEKVTPGDLVPSGAVLVDGLGIGDVGNVVLRDRRLLSQDGLLVAAVGIDEKKRRLLSRPDIVTRGFVYVKENEELMHLACDTVEKTVKEALENPYYDTGEIRNLIREDLKRLLYTKTKRSPMILPVITTLEEEDEFGKYL